jgi:hypothetical protein
MYKLLARIYSFFITIRSYLATLFITNVNIEKIPIVINNRNRLTFLLQLIDFLEKNNFKNIIIIDNNSTYPPLLEFYENTNYKIIYLNENLGYLALEKIELYNKIRKSFYVYTDPDIVPILECPSDFMDYFLHLLRKYPKIQKVGFSLKLDDIPDFYNKKNEVIEWESKYYDKIIQENVFDAPIDTTFALHKPYSMISTRGIFKMARTGFPYQARHMPWYNNSENLSEEELYYINNVEIGTQWSKGLEIKEDTYFIRKLKQLIKLK